MSNDTPTGAAIQGQGTQPAGDSANAGGPDANVKTYTQAEVNRMIADRLSREKAASEKKADQLRAEAVSSWRDENGLTDEALARLSGEDKAAADLRRVVREKAELEKKHAELSSKFGRAHSRLVDDVTRAAVISHAAKASVDPESVYLHLKDRLRVEDDYSVTILENGEPAHGKAISDLVSELLEAKPFLARPTGEPGAGTRPNGRGGNQASGPDLKTREGRAAALKSAGWT